MVINKNIENFTSGNLVVNCRSYEECKAFLGWCYENVFNDDPSNVYCTYFNEEWENTCYRMLDVEDKLISYGAISTYRTLGCDVLTYKEFMRGIGRVEDDSCLDYKGMYEKLLDKYADLEDYSKELEGYLHNKYSNEINALVCDRNRLLEEVLSLRKLVNTGKTE